MTDPRELKGSGLKVTVPRLKVLELFQHSNQRHLSAEDVYRKLLEDHADVGLATVYRTLAALESDGVVEVVSQEGGEAAYRLCSPGHHHHLVCSGCGAVVEIPGPRGQEG